MFMQAYGTFERMQALLGMLHCMCWVYRPDCAAVGTAMLP
jgi:hypothetical protein